MCLSVFVLSLYAPCKNTDSIRVVLNSSHDMPQIPSLEGLRFPSVNWKREEAKI